jgi:hypothetical protein
LGVKGQHSVSIAAIRAMQIEGEIRANPELRADPFVARWQSLARERLRFDRSGDWQSEGKVRNAMGDLAKNFNRDPQLESILRNRGRELGIPMDGGRGMGQNLPDSLGLGRGRGLSLFDLVEGIPSEASACPAAAAQHFAPVTLNGPIDFYEAPEISGNALMAIVAAQDDVDFTGLVTDLVMPYSPHQLMYRPYRRFADVLADAGARIGGHVDWYSFIAVDFHHILLASLPAHSLALRPARRSAYALLMSLPPISPRPDSRWGGLTPCWGGNLTRWIRQARPGAPKHVGYLKREGVTRNGANARMFRARLDDADISDELVALCIFARAVLARNLSCGD